MLLVPHTLVLVPHTLVVVPHTLVVVPHTLVQPEVGCSYLVVVGRENPGNLE